METIRQRAIAKTIAKRLNERNPLIQVVIGPRQIGKTTALQAALSDRGVYQSADSPAPLPVSLISEWWNSALRSDPPWLAIDEIQKIPGWSEELKRLWDNSKQRPHVVVTGSSALLMEKGLKETLAGRFELLRAEHWNLAEAREVFNFTVEDFIDFGCYPGSVRFLGSRSPSDIDRWGAYVRDSIVEPAIGRDLLQLHPVEQPGLLRQVFAGAVALPAEIVSLQKLQGQLQSKGSLPTIKNYLSILAEAFLLTPVPKFSPNQLRSRDSSPKLIVHDNSLLRAFERPIAAPLSAERRGRYLENAVGARLIEAGWEVYYWRDRDREVDFVALGPLGEKLAIEVKSSSPTESDLRSLSLFCSRHPDFEPCVVSLSSCVPASVRSISAEEILAFSRPTM